ncbi:hypothetical protein FJW07_09780 [Mesorhizobium sp. B3-1-9]|uniref:hypothetical protein n=1 Tax=unclassified Mesorhizobium TaxID=325217 RepID=UPI00112A6474|nr:MULTISPECIES: hypothetical protein [unclassified Mesorhizobium]TPI40458.1 hypothetical protein FJW07_09780 [Mesorhizobium sp. B3-1-9]TPI63638.1 hypothetical protein FJ417_04935 [Mesorhizobium sp. B3-1-7]
MLAKSREELADETGRVGFAGDHRLLPKLAISSGAQGGADRRRRRFAWRFNARRGNGMARQIMRETLGAKEVRQLKEVYDRARAVQARYAESHLAGRAAKTLIDAFEAPTDPDDTALDPQWLSKAAPKGNA